jgi:hypothetical protein
MPLGQRPYLNWNKPKNGMVWAFSNFSEVQLQTPKQTWAKAYYWSEWYWCCYEKHYWFIYASKSFQKVIWDSLYPSILYLHTYNGINFKNRGEGMAAKGKWNQENRVNRKHNEYHKTLFNFWRWALNLVVNLPAAKTKGKHNLLQKLWCP